MEPDVLVLDEPSSNLDPASRRELAEVLRSLDLTMLMVTHDLPYALELCPRAVIMDAGVLVADGPTAEVLGDLIDASSVGGATFELGSAAYDMTRVATGQLDAYVEPGPRLVADVPGMRTEFERVGDGAVLNNSPYDLAAAALILEEAGAVVSDAYGRPLSDRPLLGSGAEFQMSVVASANRALHDLLLEAVDAGVRRLCG
jgi:hypothetical protein